MQSLNTLCLLCLDACVEPSQVYNTLSHFIGKKTLISQRILLDTVLDAVHKLITTESSVCPGQQQLLKAMYFNTSPSLSYYAKINFILQRLNVGKVFYRRKRVNLVLKNLQCLSYQDNEECFELPDRKQISTNQITMFIF